jgi:hypothetical protein
VEQVVPSGSNAAIIHCEAARGRRFSTNSANESECDALWPTRSPKNSASKSKRGVLVSPNTRNALKQPLDRHGSRLATFDDRLNDVGRQIAANAVARKVRLRGSASILTGRIYDDRGNGMSPTHSNKLGVRYRYYVSHALLQNRKGGGWQHQARAGAQDRATGAGQRPPVP